MTAVLPGIITPPIVLNNPVAGGVALTINQADAAASIKVTPTGNAGASTSTGGAVNLDNSGSTGAGVVLYTNRGGDASGRLLVLNVNNPLCSQSALHVINKGATHGVTIVHDSTGVNAQALNVTSTNQNDTAFGISGMELAKGTIKLTHNYPGAPDPNASALSIRVNGPGTQAQGIFFDSDDATLTGDILKLRNFGANRLVLSAGGQVQLGVDGSTGGIAAGASLDVVLFRGAADTWRSNDLIQVVRSLASGDCFQATVSGMSPGPFVIKADGTIEWGSGNVARSVKLYFGPGENQFKTDDTLIVADGVVTKTKAGVPSDADFQTVPPDGVIVVDTTNKTPWFRTGSTYRSTRSRAEIVSAAQGLVAETMPRSEAVNTSVLTSQTIYFGLVALREGESVTNIDLQFTGAGAAYTAAFVALYTTAGVRLALSNDISGTIALGVPTLPLSAPYVVPAGGEGAYYTAFLANAGTPPTVIRSSGQTSKQIGANPRQYAAQTGQTAMPANATLADAALALWMGAT